MHKNKFQMPNIDKLIDSLSQQLSHLASQSTTYFSIRFDIFAYMQLYLDPSTPNHCDFNMISADMTGRF